MTAAVVGDGAEAVRGDEHHLVVPGVGVERPAVAEDDGLSAAPVLVEDARAVRRVQCGTQRAAVRRASDCATTYRGRMVVGGQTVADHRERELCLSRSVANGGFGLCIARVIPTANVPAADADDAFDGVSDALDSGPVRSGPIACDF